MAPIAAAGFEAAALTGSDAFTSTTGAGITLDSASKIKGTYSAATDNVTASFGAITFTGVATLWASFYLFLTAIPATMRILQIRDTAAATVGELVIVNTGKVRLRQSGVQVGSDSTLTLATSTLYRLGIRQTVGSGTGILAGYVVAGDADFGAAFASSSAQTIANNANEIRVGGTNSVVVNGWLDDIRLDDAQMPAPSIEWLRWRDPAFALKVQ